MADERTSPPGPLEVKVLWGPIVLGARLFGADQVVTVGSSPKAGFRLDLDHFRGEDYTLATPGGSGRHAIHVAADMELSLRRDGVDMDAGELPPAGAKRAFTLEPGDRARVLVGQLAFVVQYVPMARGVRSRAAWTRDMQLGKCWSVTFVLAVGLWLAIEATPSSKRGGLDDPESPARFARLIDLLDQIRDRPGVTGHDDPERVFGPAGIRPGRPQQGRERLLPDGFGGWVIRGVDHRSKDAVRTHRGRIRQGRTRVSGGLPRFTVDCYLKRYWAQLKYCYERKLCRDPTLAGTITTRFSIAGSGRVTGAQTIQSSMHDAGVEQCLLHVFGRIRFPPPRGGGVVEVSYRLIFTTAG